MSLFSFQLDDAVFVPPADSASDYHDIDDNTIDHNEYPVDNKANDDENLQVSKLLNFLICWFRECLSLASLSKA